jgi:hypothetical protein
MNPLTLIPQDWRRASWDLALTASLLRLQTAPKYSDWVPAGKMVASGFYFKKVILDRMLHVGRVIFCCRLHSARQGDTSHVGEVQQNEGNWKEDIQWVLCETAVRTARRSTIASARRSPSECSLKTNCCCGAYLVREWTELCCARCGVKGICWEDPQVTRLDCARQWSIRRPCVSPRLCLDLGSR